MMKSTNLYIKIDKNNLVDKKTVYFKDIAKIYCADKKLQDDINNEVLMTISENKKCNFIFSLLIIIEQINEKYPEVEVINLGEKDFIVHYDPPKKTLKLIEYSKVAFVAFMIFFGAAFTIMTFNEDAGVQKVFNTIYELIMGKKKDGGSILEIAYSIGLPMGIVIFFNHFSKAKLGNDPTPMQVQMRLYEEDLDKTLIENASREGKSNDIS